MATSLRQDQASDSPILAQMSAGDRFDALDFASNAAWGISTKTGLVGYVDRSAIDFLKPLEGEA